MIYKKACIYHGKNSIQLYKEFGELEMIKAMKMIVLV